MRAVRRGMLTAAAGLAVVVLAIVGLFVWHSADTEPATKSQRPTNARSATSAQLADRRCFAVHRESVVRQPDRPVTTGGPVAVVLGDSWAAGTFLPNPRAQAWSTLIGRQKHWTTYVNAVGGTGFANPGACGGQTYGDRVPAVLALHPELVLIEGGLNDDAVAPAHETNAERAVLERLASVPTVIVVGPPKAPTRPHTAAIDRALAAGAAADQRRYISTQKWSLPLRGDRLHMTAAGHPIFARDLATAIG